MREIFYEESSTLIDFKSASFKYNFFAGFAIVAFLLNAPWLFVFAPGWLFDAKISLFLKIVLGGIPVVIFTLIGIFSWKYKNKFFVEYDYVFVDGSIRFSKVIKQKKRQFIIKFEASDIEKIGKIGSKTFYLYANRENVSTHVLTKNEYPADGKDFFYMVATVNTDTYLFVLECTEKFISNVLQYSRRSGILDEEIK